MKTKTTLNNCFYIIIIFSAITLFDSCDLGIMGPSAGPNYQNNNESDTLFHFDSLVYPGQNSSFNAIFDDPVIFSFDSMRTNDSMPLPDPEAWRVYVEINYGTVRPYGSYCTLLDVYGSNCNVNNMSWNITPSESYFIGGGISADTAYGHGYLWIKMYNVTLKKQ